MAAAGVQILALTDHDTTAGIAAATERAHKHGMQFVPGVEISALWQKQTVHIVGLGIDPQSSVLQVALAEVQATREERAQAIAQRLEKIGVQNVFARAKNLSQGGQITRPHFARLLVEDGLVKDSKRAFKRFLSQGKPAWVAAAWPEMGQVIEWIHMAGGLAVLAHPMHYGLTGNKRRRLLDAFVAAAGDAMEVHCGSNAPQDNQVSVADAKRLHLMASVGSDFHDPEQRWIKLGSLPPVTDELSVVWQHPALRVAA